jgi:hypothetical protein
MLVEGYETAIRPAPQLHSGCVQDDAGQPGGNLRVTLELIKVPEGGQKRILEGILSIVRIPEFPKRDLVKRRGMPGKQLFEDPARVFRSGAGN